MDRNASPTGSARVSGPEWQTRRRWRRHLHEALNDALLERTLQPWDHNDRGCPVMQTATRVPHRPPSRLAGRSKDVPRQLCATRAAVPLGMAVAAPPTTQNLSRACRHGSSPAVVCCAAEVATLARARTWVDVHPAGTVAAPELALAVAPGRAGPLPRGARQLGAREGEQRIPNAWPLRSLRQAPPP